MSGQPKVVVWKADYEISVLRDLLYSGDADSRCGALAKIRAYQTRGPIPHSVEATSLLMAAMVNDRPETDNLAVRLSYAMAIVRFVNGLLDPSQKSQYAIPLHALARTLDLPSAFVELRHMATHEWMPSLEALRDLSGRALDWLWSHYWNVNSYEQAEENSHYQHKREVLKELFREWRRIRRADPSKLFKTGDGTPEGLEFWKLVRKIQARLDQDEGLFVDVLLQMNVLIPSGKESLKKVAGVIKLFGPLLELLNKDGFVQRLTMQALNILNRQTTELDFMPCLYSGEMDGESPDEQFFAALKTWIKLFLTPIAKKNTQQWLQDAEEVVQEILVLPRRWNCELLDYYLSVVENVDDKIPRLAGQMSNQVALLESSGGGLKRKAVTDIETEVEGYTKRLRGEKSVAEHESKRDDKLESWSLAINWTTRPIGVL
jgi:ribosomal biogenesis protein LAS1